MAGINIKSFIKLSTVSGVGSKRLRLLLQHFTDPAEVFRSSLHELAAVPLIDPGTAERILAAGSDASLDSSIDTRFDIIHRLGGEIITLLDDDYPAALRNIYDPPAYLYVLGRLAERDRDAVAIVGTRSPSPYGRAIAELFSRGLTESGISVISGLARGIDSIAHTTTVGLGGRTIAVIGSGPDIIYPPENKELSERICADGALVTEYDPGTKPDAGNFPRRNRIISGMSLGTVVIESSETGGAMITASYALDQNREVFAVPGNVTERRSIGTNKLIQRGHAKLVLTVEDVLVEISEKLRYTNAGHGKNRSLPELPALSTFEQKIFDTLSGEPTHIDRIAEQSGLSISDTLVHLLSLEFKSVVKQLAGKMFLRV
jgi:DNA processing protein